MAADLNFLDLGYTRLDEGGDYGLASSFGVGPGQTENSVFAEPTDPVSIGQFEVELRTRLLPAGTTSPATAATLYDLLQYGGRVPDPPGWVLPAAERARLARVTSHYRALKDNAEYRDVRVGFAPLRFFAGGTYESIAVPRTRVEHLSPAPIHWLHDAIWYGGQAFIDFLGPAFVPNEPGQRTDERWFGAPLHARGYGDRGEDWMFVGVADLRDTGGHNGYPWEWSEDPVATQAFRLYRNGQLVGSARDPLLQVTVPATRASYRVERDLNLHGLTRLANVSRTRWWFTSAAPPGQEPYALLPLLAVDYQAAPLGGATAPWPGSRSPSTCGWPGRRGRRTARWSPPTCGSRPTTPPPDERSG